MQIRPLRPWLVALLLILIGSHAAFYLFRVSSWSELVDYEWISLLVFVIYFPAGLALMCRRVPATAPPSRLPASQTTNRQQHAPRSPAALSTTAAIWCDRLAGLVPCNRAHLGAAILELAIGRTQRRFDEVRFPTTGNTVAGGTHSTYPRAQSVVSQRYPYFSFRGAE
jgi:hypothetical protein